MICSDTFPHVQSFKTYCDVVCTYSIISVWPKLREVASVEYH